MEYVWRVRGECVLHEGSGFFRACEKIFAVVFAGEYSGARYTGLTLKQATDRVLSATK